MSISKIRPGIMHRTYYIDHLVESGEFRFDKLEIKGIDNIPVKKFHNFELIEEEICLFHRDITSGDDYFEILHRFICEALSDRKAAPVVRFADGEYAFYSKNLQCNGLYRQAESVRAINEAMPLHIKTLKVLAESGKIAPLIYQENVRHKQKGLLSFLTGPKDEISALKFADLLFDNDIVLNRDNYLPFYVVYAYLTSKKFADVVDGRKISVISSECNKDLCVKWFDRFSSRPDITFTEIPDSYVATQWPLIKEDIFESIPPDIEICLAGAGVGALLVCVDVADRFSIPAIDAGHVLNMMNGREEKSSGPRLYTIR